jgi:hypothetical protein
MIFGQDHVSYDDFSDRHDEAGVDFIVKRSFCGLYLQGEECF